MLSLCVPKSVVFSAKSQSGERETVIRFLIPLLLMKIKKTLKLVSDSKKRVSCLQVFSSARYGVHYHPFESRKKPATIYKNQIDFFHYL